MHIQRQIKITIRDVKVDSENRQSPNVCRRSSFIMYCLLYFLLKESLYSLFVCLFGPCWLHAVNHWCVLTHTCNYYTTAATVIGNKAISKSVLILLTYIAHASLYLKQKYLKKLRKTLKNVILDIRFWWKAY